MSFCQLLDKYTRGVQAKTIQAIDRSKYLKEVILKIKLLYKSFLCIFNFVGPGYLMSEMIRIQRRLFLIPRGPKYPGPTKLNMQRRDLQRNFILRITSFRYFDLSIAFCFCLKSPCIFIQQLAEAHSLIYFSDFWGFNSTP